MEKMTEPAQEGKKQNWKIKLKKSFLLDGKGL